MTTQKDYWGQSQHHAKPWDALMKQQLMLVVAVLPCWIITAWFLTTTPDDECSFRGRLYAKLHDWVSELTTIYSISELFVSHKILSLCCSFNQVCAIKLFKKGIIFLYHTELTTNYSISELFVAHKFFFFVFFLYTQVCAIKLFKKRIIFLYHTKLTNHYSHECLFWNDYFSTTYLHNNAQKMIV